MKFDFNKPALTLSGEPFLIIQDGRDPVVQTLGMVLAGQIANLTKGDIIKYLDWARDLYRGKTIDLDRGDQKTMKALIEGFEKLSILYKGQLLELLDEKVSEEALTKVD
jgi:hypothetical protein